MKREETLLSAMGGMEDRFLMEAENYGKKRRSAHRGIMILVAAAAVLAISGTALAVNSTWRETIRGWFGVEAGSDEGYAEYDGQNSVTMGDLTVQPVSELCSGNQLVTFLEVTPPAGETLLSDITYEAQILDEQLWADNVNLMDLTVVSSAPDDVLLKLTVGFEDMSSVQELPVRCYMHPEGTYKADWNDSDIVYSDELTLQIADTPVLSGEVSIPLENEEASSTGEIMAVRVCSGSLEIIVGHESFETWCTRECVPDSGVSFMEKYTGKAWTPGTPEFDGDTTPYFTPEDELAIASAYAETWENTITAELDTVKITLADGSELELQGEPTVSENERYSGDGIMDADTYRYTILPLVSLDEIQQIEISGQAVQLELQSQAE